MGWHLVCLIFFLSLPLSLCCSVYGCHERTVRPLKCAILHTSEDGRCRKRRWHFKNVFLHFQFVLPFLALNNSRLGHLSWGEKASHKDEVQTVAGDGSTLFLPWKVVIWKESCSFIPQNRHWQPLWLKGLHHTSPLKKKNSVWSATPKHQLFLMEKGRLPCPY